MTISEEELGELVVTLDETGTHRTTRTYRKKTWIDDPNDGEHVPEFDEWVEP